MNPACEDEQLQGEQTPHKVRVYVVVKALWKRCTARLTWVRETHGINSTNISGPAGGG